MSILKRLALLSLVGFGFSGKAFACEPIFQAWDGENYQGKQYRFGKNCENTKNWNNKISSFKVHRDHVIRACGRRNMKGACSFLLGDVPKLADYRPTGINLNNKISSFEPESQPRSKITIAAFYDAPNPQFGDRGRSLRSQNVIRVHNEIDRIKKILHNSGLNVDVIAQFHEVNNVDAQKIHQSARGLATATNLLRDRKAGHVYGIYFPSKVPVSARNGKRNWNGIAYQASQSNESDHARYLKNSGIVIVNPDAPVYVVAHEWGHTAGLGHLKNGGGIKSYGGGHISKTVGLRSFSTVMVGSLAARTIRRNKFQLVFSNPQTRCDFDLSVPLPVSRSCGQAGQSDARQALLETVLQWHQK